MDGHSSHSPWLNHGAKLSVYKMPLIDWAWKVNVNVKQRHWFNWGWIFKDYLALESETLEHRTSALSIGKKWKYLTELVVDDSGNDSWQLGWPRDFSILILIWSCLWPKGLSTLILSYLGSNGFSTSIWSLSECRSKVFSSSIWSCWNGNQRFSLLQSGVVEMAIKGLLYLNLELSKFWPPISLFLLFSFLLHLLSTSLPPLTLFTFFFPLIFLLHLTISSHKKTLF